MGPRELSTGDQIFLAFLKNGPRSSYDLKKEMSSSVNFFWSAQHSQVYQQANRLRRDGYIEPRGAAAARNRQLLALTDKGTEAVERWLREPAASYRVHDESLAKLYFASLSGVEATTELLDDQEQRHAKLLHEFEELDRVLSTVDPGNTVPGQYYTLQLGMEVERAYLRWIRRTLQDLRQRGGDAAPR
jgi:PadR family transcriptional regulator, regulatory protein AphA